MSTAIVRGLADFFGVRLSAAQISDLVFETEALYNGTPSGIDNTVVAYERPVYFVEMRDGYTCCWCTLKGDHILLQSHPLSPVPVRVLRHPQDAEVIGQVVGVALKLGDWRPVESASEPKPEERERAALN